jgi:predicted nuclease of predicted toxin-antitoxin system
MKFLLDENVHRGLYFFLSKLGHDAKLTPKTIENGEVFRLSISEQRLLITRDKDTIQSSGYIYIVHFLP